MVMPSRHLAAALATLALPLGLFACSSSTEARVQHLSLVSGDGQSGLVGAPLPQPLTVLLTNPSGLPMAGATVTFATASGGSVGTPTATTDVNGHAQTTWTLGPSLGAQTATAQVAGAAGSPVSFTATGATVAMTGFVGDSQTGLVGWAVNVRPAVRIVDTSNTPVSGRSVTFAVAGGGGSVVTATVTSNALGIAQVGRWVLGTAAGVNTLTATAAGLGSYTFTATGQTAAYPIQIMNIGPPLSAPVQAALDSAQAKWQRIIYRSVGTWPNLSEAAGQWCGGTPGSPAISQAVPGLLILVKFDSIDGPGKILGEAGPCYVRPGTDFTIGGLMFFDTADVATMVGNGTLNSVMLHEMGHVIGFGTLWGYNNNCLALPSDTAHAYDTYFSCGNGQAAFDSIGGLTYTGASLSPPGGNKVPVENCGASSPSGCGAGTINSHWREPVFGNELMTGYVNLGANPLSLVTAAQFADMGYGVNYAAADPYTHPFTARAAAGAAPIPMGDDILHRPILEVDQQGRVVRIRPAR